MHDSLFVVEYALYCPCVCVRVLPFFWMHTSVHSVLKECTSANHKPPGVKVSVDVRMDAAVVLLRASVQEMNVSIYGPQSHECVCAR